MTETVNHPKHYTSGKIEVIEFLEDQQLDFHSANAVKYICRAGRKDPTKEVEDLKKAIWYLQRKVEILSPNPRRPNDMNSRSGGACGTGTGGAFVTLCEHSELISDGSSPKQCVRCGKIFDDG
jgi:hypothetical protein